MDPARGDLARTRLSAILAVVLGLVLGTAFACTGGIALLHAWTYPPGWETAAFEGIVVRCEGEEEPRKGTPWAIVAAQDGTEVRMPRARGMSVGPDVGQHVRKRADLVTFEVWIEPDPRAAGADPGRWSSVSPVAPPTGLAWLLGIWVASCLLGTALVALALNVVSRRRAAAVPTAPA